MDPTHLQSLWKICEPGLVPASASKIERDRAQAAFFAGMVSILMLLHRIREHGDTELSEFLDAIEKEIPTQPSGERAAAASEESGT